MTSAASGLGPPPGRTTRRWPVSLPPPARIVADAPLPRWPLVALITGYPLWFLVGLGGFVWVLLAAPMALALVGRRGLVLPKGTTWWFVFLVAVVGSGLSIDTAGRMAGYLLRLGYYGAATVFLLYLVNGRGTARGAAPDGGDVPTATIVRSFTWLWMAAVAGGYLAFALGDVSFRSPTAYVMPGFLLGNELIATLVTPGFADLHDVIGFPVPRPKAPFPYTNSWGSMVALTTPFALIALSDARVGIDRRLLRVVLVASSVPIVLSLNRGLWLSLGIGALYVAVRLVIANRGRGALRMGVGVVVIAAIVVISPLGSVVQSRVDNGHSDGDRLSLVTAAVDGAAERPLFGWGAPRPSGGNLPSTGTHGQVWLVLFSHGFVGAVGFVAAMVTFAVVTARQRTTAGLWAHAVIVIALVQLPVYLWIPHSLFTVMAAVAVALRAPR